jgi:DNA-binding NtrC family response regulator
VALFAKRNREISAVITDMGMPNLDGANLAYVVHQLNPEVKILVMSGMSNADPDPKTVGYASAFMVKPFKAEALLEMVHKLLHPERAGSPPV